MGAQQAFIVFTSHSTAWKDRINVDGADLTGIVAVEAPADVLEKDLGWVHVAEGVHGRRVLLVHAV